LLRVRMKIAREPVEKSVENLGEWGLKIGGRNGGALTVW
jgi:hypothetical protein